METYSIVKIKTPVTADKLSRHLRLEIYSRICISFIGEFIFFLSEILNKYLLL
jgi:hypothetical protein